MTHRINRQPHNPSGNRRQADFEELLKSPLYAYHPLSTYKAPEDSFKRRSKVEKQTTEVLNVQEFKFELEEPQTVVKYIGIKLMVPNGKGWLTVNCEDQIYWHEHRPDRTNLFWYQKSGRYVFIGTLKDTPHKDWWKDSLMEVTNEVQG